MKLKLGDIRQIQILDALNQSFQVNGAVVLVDGVVCVVAYVVGTTLYYKLVLTDGTFNHAVRVGKNKRERLANLLEEFKEYSTRFSLQHTSQKRI